MKKKLVLLASLAVITSASLIHSFSANNSSKTVLLMQNIEALANGESGGGGGGGGNTYWCHYHIRTVIGSTIRFCGTCTFLENSAAGSENLMGICPL